MENIEFLFSKNAAEQSVIVSEALLGGADTPIDQSPVVTTGKLILFKKVGKVDIRIE